MDYRFKPISKNCAGTGDPLLPGEICYSVLIEGDTGFERLDFSEAGWDGLPQGAIGYWKCVVPVPEQTQSRMIDPDTLMQYFEQLSEDANPHQERLLYVLALHLLQRRRLHLDGSRRVDDIEFLQLAGSRGEGPFEVKDQQLSETEIAEIRSVLDQELATQWNAA